MAIPNLQALANIGANLGEIARVAHGGILVLGSWIPAINRCPGHCKKMLLTGGLLLSAGFLFPLAVNYFQAINEIVAALISWAFCIPILIFVFKACNLPGTIASEANHPYSVVILFLAVLGIVCPFHLTWYIALFAATHFAGKKGKGNKEGNDDQKSGNDVVEEV